MSAEWCNEYPGSSGWVQEEGGDEYPADRGWEDCYRPRPQPPDKVWLVLAKGMGPDDEKRARERCEQDKLRYKRELQEYAARWPRLRVERLERWIKFLHKCRRTPAAERPRNLEKWVYLLRCPTLGLHKIGQTEDLGRRLSDLRRDLQDPKAEYCVRYRTPLDLLLLEGRLLHHFDYRHVYSRLSDELFKLCPEEEQGFEATVAAIERHLLDIEALRLKHLLDVLEAECRQTGR